MKPPSRLQLLGTRATKSVALGLLLLMATFVLGDQRTSIAAEPPVYLAIGDSVSTGAGATVPATSGFVPLMVSHTDYLTLNNIAVNGETAASLIADGQLAAALAHLTERNQNASEFDNVELITLSIGGNDLKPLFETCPFIAVDECLSQAETALGVFGTDLGTILGQLRAAAGTDTQIIVMTYYNALLNPGCPLASFAELADQIVSQLNGAIAAAAGAVADITVADVAGAGIVADDLHPDCLHPDDSGYEKISEAFAAAYAVPSGGFTPPVGAGSTLTIYRGGSVAKLSSEAAAAGATAVFVTVDGAFVVLLTGAPSFVNEPFNAAFPDGLPDGMPILVVGD